MEYPQREMLRVTIIILSRFYLDLQRLNVSRSVTL